MDQALPREEEMIYKILALTGWLLITLAIGMVIGIGLGSQTECKEEAKIPFDQCLSICDKYYDEGCWESCLGVFEKTGKLL